MEVGAYTESEEAEDVSGQQEAHSEDRLSRGQLICQGSFR